MKKMKKTKKIISLLVVLSMILVTFAACRGNQNEGESLVSSEIGDIGDTGGLRLPLDNNNTEISILLNTSETGLSDSVVFKELSRRTGLKIKTIEVPSSVLSQKVSTLMATGDQYPDIMSGGSTINETNKYGEQGAFEEVLKHKDELPNFKKIFIDEAEEHNTKGKLVYWYSPKGGLYIFPTYDTSREVNHGMLYRKDIFDKHDIKMWTNEEEFYKALKKLKEIYPDSIPFVTKNGIAVLDDLLSFYGIRRVEIYNHETGKWSYGGIDPRTKDLLDLLRKLIDEGLMDPEFATTTQSAWTQKMSQRNKSFVTYDWIARMDQFKAQTQEIIPEYDLRYGNTISSEQKLMPLNNVGIGPRVKAGKKALLSLKLLDYMLSPSGSELMTMGIEGVTYNLDENGKAVYVGFEDRKPNVTELSAKFGAFTGGGYVRADRKSVHFQFTELEQEAQDFPKTKGNGFWPLKPSLSFDSNEADVLNDKLVILSREFDEFAIKYLLSDETGDAAWNAWLNEADKLGMQDVLNVLNTAQKRYDKNASAQ